MQMVCRFLFILTFVFQATYLFAQWQNVAPNLLGNFSQRARAEAAMTFNDGMLWVGRTSLSVSPDTGKTWSLSYQGFQGSILDICAHDKNTCMFSTNRGELYITKDGGSSWQLLKALNGTIHAIAFFDNPRHIIAFEGGPYAYLTHDGGATWTPKLTNAEVLDCKWLGGGVLYFSTGAITTKRGSISISTDYGETWRQTPGTYDYDSYSFEVASCKPGNILAVNEDYLDPYDQQSCIFRSTDNGTTWQPIASRDRTLDFFCGSISATRLAVFAQTHLSGVMRSTDDGLTWISIGGPNGDFDTRLVTAINSNIVFAVDHTDGSVYRTITSGTDSLDDHGFEPLPLSISVSTLFESDTVEQCDSTRTRSLIIRHRECTAPQLATETVSGFAQQDYTLLTSLPSVLSGSDTVRIRFDPTTDGMRDAQYEIVLSDGRTLVVDLLGTGSGLDTVFFNPRTPLDFDSLYTCDAPTLLTIYLSYIGCNPRTKGSERIDGSPDFTIAAAAPDSIGSNDFVRIAFKPSTEGLHTGTYVLTLSNGETISIPLIGFGKESDQVDVITSNQEFDTLGVDVRVPITLSGLDKAATIELVVHYDVSLTYLGTQSVNGSILDIAGQQTPGRSKIRITAAQLNMNGVSAYAVFGIVTDSFFTPRVWFDSLNILSGTATPCAGRSQPAISEIALPPGCNFPMIAKFFFYGTPPTLSIKPNPTAGGFSVISSRSLGDVQLQLFDQVGKVVYLKNNVPVLKDRPVILDLSLPISGYHRLVITSPYGTWSKPVLIQK